jgi:VWFA-related protein
MPGQMIGRFGLLLAGAGLALGAFASAQRSAPPQQPVFRSTADLVQVDVVVVDKSGNPVRGLKSSDFTVFDRRKSQTIAVFEEVAHAYAGSDYQPALPPTVRRDVADNRKAQSQRLVVVVADDLHIYRGRTDTAKDLTKQIISRLGPDASMALLFTSGEHSTQVTEDRATLLAAADTLKGRQSVRRPTPAIDAQGVSGLDPEMALSARLKVLGTAGTTSLQEFYDNLTQYKTLQDAARFIGADDARRKAFVLLSEGIGKDLRGMFEGEMTPCELETPSAPCYHDIALRQMMESMRRSNVATYAIDPRGRVSSQDLLRESFPSTAGLTTSLSGNADDEDPQFRWNNPVRRAQDGLTMMSEASGGFAVTDTDDFTSGLSRILEDLDHYYLLGFYPSDRTGKGYRPLGVTVPGHPDWTLRFRKGYMPGGPPALPANTDPLAALSAGVMPKADLPLRLFATPFPAAASAAGATTSRMARIAVALEITAPTAAMREADGKLHDDVSYEVLVADENKNKVTSRTGREAQLVLKPGVVGPAPETVSYQIGTALDLAPGRYQLRASASSVKLAKGGSVYLTIDVPDFSASPLSLSGLVLGYADGARVPVAPAPTPGPARGASPVTLPFAASLDRHFSTADTLRLYFEVAQKSGSAALRAKVEFVAEGDQIPVSFDLEPRAGSRSFDVPLPLRDLAPGLYRLRVTATDGAHSAQRETGLSVR